MAPVLVVGLLSRSILPLVLLFPVSTAAAGAIGLRVAMLSWRQTVLSAVLAGTALPVIAGLLSLWNLGGGYLFLALIAGLTWVSGGVFLLPLFDPVVRKTRPAPSTWKVVVTALALSAPFLAAFILQRTFHVGGSFSLFLQGLVPVIPVLMSVILLAGGFILTLFKLYTPTAAWLGGLGILFACFTLYGGIFVEVATSRLAR
jgi:hypothetical protein